MNNFEESKVRRATDGKFAHKPHAEAEFDLDAFLAEVGGVTFTDDEMREL